MVLKASSKGRTSTGRAFGSPAPSGFGGFATTASSTGSLSYLSDTPDLSSISDANIVVSFKSLLKKDTTTKSKGLAELIQYTQAHPYEQDGGVENAILDAWVQLYPRTSIDNDRRVRELSHTLQFELLKSARKRMEKNIPKIAAAWLAGTFDREKPVARAANEGLATFLTTEDKVTQFWRKCQSQILQFAIEAILETPDTLSDERSTKPEDAEAKYYRVIAASFSLVLGLLQRLSKEDTDKFESDYDTFFSSGPSDSAWTFSTCDDSRVRKNVYQLMQLCLEQRQDLIQPHVSRIARTLTSDALKKSQLGSATELVSVLAKLTQQDQDLWGTKKSPLARLRPFIEKGSQGGSSNFWQTMDKLLACVPLDTVSAETTSEFLKSFRTGISRRDEPRANAAFAWMCYLNMLARLVHHLDSASRIKVVTTDLFPLTEHYLLSHERQGEWLSGLDVSLLSRAYRVAARSVDSQVKEACAKDWNRLADALVARLSNSLPEVSKEFEISQNKIADDGKRWFSLVGAIHPDLIAFSKQQNGQEISDYTQDASWTVIRGAADLLKRRNYKPFGAAAILLSALKSAPHLFTLPGTSSWTSLLPVASDEEMAKLLTSPSAPHVISSVVVLGQQKVDDFSSLWSTTIRCLLQQSGNPQANVHITKLISDSVSKDLARSNVDLLQYLEKSMISCAQGGQNSWDLFDAILVWDVLPDSNLQSVASSTVDMLSSDRESSMKAAEVLLRRRSTLFSTNEALHLALVTKLLAMMEIGDASISSRARQLHSLLEKHADAQPSVLSIIQDNLEHPGPASLGIDTLVQQAIAISKTNSGVLEQIFPNIDVWSRELGIFLQNVPSPALALTSNIAGAYFLAQETDTITATQLQRDQRGLSTPARMAMYTTSLLHSGVAVDDLAQNTQVDLLYLLYLVAELASDQITLRDQNQLFTTLEDSTLLEEVEDFVVSTRKLMNGVFAKSKDWRPGSGEGLLDSLVTRLINSASSLEPAGIYSARALSEILESFADTHGHGNIVENWIAERAILKATASNVLPSVAILTGYGEIMASSKTVSTLLNRLVSDIAGAKPNAESTRIVLVLLNACMPVFEIGHLPVANNRLVFAVKQIRSWFEEGPEALGSVLATESCRALQRLLPCIGEVYGPHWDEAIDFCLSLWAHARKDDPEARLPYIHASVKLLASLRSIEEPNDDLVDALESHSEAVNQGLLDLLKLPGSRKSQPQEIVDALLCREVAKIPSDYLKDLSELYSLVASDSRENQTAGFNLLHRALPAVQKEMAYDLLLEKKQAKLPDELTSLLLDAPTLEAYPEEELVQFPSPIRSYLLSWKLVFDAYSGAVHKARGDFTEDLKTNGAIEPLMQFMFDVLGHSAASPINLDKEGLTADDIQNYDINIADSLPEEKNMHWLLVHLFYLTLQYAPGLFKSWFLDCRSKQTKIAIEPWMTKYFTPLIVHHALVEVEEWARSQDVGSSEKELIIKVHYNQGEITAAYPIDDDGDEQQAVILLKVKPNYPLEYVDVAGLNRVGCSERTWTSWLRVTQGIITINNGAIVDGLLTFRHNVVGALKGQVECAICYSYIAVDKKMPDKKCTTCKNLFHRDCLFKWLNSSNQNTCPLCRTKMDFVDKKKAARLARPGF